MRFRASTGGALACFLLVAGMSGQMMPETGTISGTVRSVAGQVLPGTLVTLSGPETLAESQPNLGKGAVRTARTDLSGVYSFTSIAYGKYHLQAEGSSFILSQPEPVSLDSRSAVVDLRLRPVQSSGSSPSEDVAPPSFALSGIEGTTAPSGYSSAVTAEQHSQVVDQAIGLDTAQAACGKKASGREQCQPESPAIAERRLAQAAAAAGHPAQAVVAYKAAAMLDSGETNLFDCGLGLIGLGAGSEAAVLMAAAVLRYPASAKLWTALGMSQQLENRQSDAMQSVIRAMDRGADYGPAYALAATFPKTGGRTDSSDPILTRLKRFSEAHPLSAEAKYDYAAGLWNRQRALGDSAESREITTLLEGAIAACPAFAQAHRLLGFLDADKDDYQAAGRELEAAVQLKPNDAEAHYRLSQIYRRLAQTSSANRELEIFKAIRSGQKAAGLRLPDDDPSFQPCFPMDPQ